MYDQILKGLVEISELRSLLGLSDKRSIMGWLRKHNAPIVVLGRKTYTQLQFIEDMVAASLGSNSTTQTPQDANWYDRNRNTTNLLKTATAVPKRSESRHNKNGHSKAATLLLNNIHSA